MDDNFDVAQTVGWMLETIGHDYRLVHEGKLAVQTAQEYRPDAILLDIGMPGMDGYEVCRALREQRSSTIRSLSPRLDGAKLRPARAPARPASTTILSSR